MSKLRLAGMSGALVAAALAGGTLISSVAAAPSPTPTAPGAAGVDALPSAAPKAGSAQVLPGPYCATFRADFAKALGVPESTLTPAARTAALETVDQAVTDGKLTAAQGTALKAKINAAPGDGCGFFGGIARQAAGPLGVAKDGVRAAATTLGIAPAQLRADLASGQTLKDEAAAHNVSYDALSAAITSAVRTGLDAAVATGRINQAREDAVLYRLQVALASGKLRPGAIGQP